MNRRRRPPSQQKDLYSSFTQTRGVPVTPVPEPETYVLLPAGLGALGGASRRRKL